MVQLNLNQEEKSILIDALESYVSDLRFEIADTERKAFREPLKNQENVLNRVLRTLRQGQGSPATALT